ncbi:hypothetical protein [Roseateles sp. BYS87W]|uniref:Uncharacterized protein n=1 Tax=Pelomonas baiyunensis TaxID=3299026 RepID=A0ABW7GUW6_9BURK
MKRAWAGLGLLGACFSAAAFVNPPAVLSVTACLSFEDDRAVLSERGEAAWMRFLAAVDVSETPTRLMLSLDPQQAAASPPPALGGEGVEQSLDRVRARAAALLARLREQRPAWGGVPAQWQVEPNRNYSVSRCHVSLTVLWPGQLAPAACEPAAARSCVVQCDAFACERRAVPPLPQSVAR